MLCRVSMRSCGRCGALVRNDMALHHICSTRLNAADETHKIFKPGPEGLTCLNKFCSVSPQGGAISWWTIRLLFLHGDVQVYWFYFAGVPCFWIFPSLRLRVFINVRDGVCWAPVMGFYTRDHLSYLCVRFADQWWWRFSNQSPL